MDLRQVLTLLLALLSVEQPQPEQDARAVFVEQTLRPRPQPRAWEPNIQ